MKEFKAFILKGNIIDMAVGVIIGGAFSKIVTSLVNDILMPLLGAPDRRRKLQHTQICHPSRGHDKRGRSRRSRHTLWQLPAKYIGFSHYRRVHVLYD